MIDKKIVFYKEKRKKGNKARKNWIEKQKIKIKIKMIIKMKMRMRMRIKTK